MKTLKIALLALAAVVVPRAVLAAEAADIAAAELKPLIEKIGEGSINWQEGAYYATVEVPYQDAVGGRPLNAARKKIAAERVAEAEASRVFLELAAKIRVDSGRTMKDLAVEDAKIKLYGNILGKQAVELKHGDKSLVATYKINMRGVGGVTSKLYKMVVKAKPAEPKVVEVPVGEAVAAPAKEGDVGEKPSGAEAAGEKPEPVVVIDARGTGARPALFPKVADEAGHTIYDASVPSEEKATSAGVASYAVVEAGEKACIHDAPGLIVVEAVYSSESGVELLQCADAGDGGAAPEAPKPRRQKRTVAKASDVAGKLDVDIVVSKADAEKLKTAEAKDAMANARVVVVTDTTVGGTEGRLRPSAREALAMIAAGAE